MRFVVKSKHKDAKKYQDFFNQVAAKEKGSGVYTIKIFDKAWTKQMAKSENKNTFIIHTAYQENTDRKKRKIVKSIVKEINGGAK